MDLLGILSVAAILLTIVGSHAALRREFKADLKDLRDGLKSDIKALDDRVYQLATGMKPLIDQAKEANRS